jgi:hypothetical protein
MIGDMSLAFSSTPRTPPVARHEAPRLRATTAGGMEIVLRGNEIHAIEPRDGLIVSCVAGSVWVSQEGTNEDVVLAAGQSFAPRPRGKIVIQPLPPEINAPPAGAIVIAKAAPTEA